MSGHEQISEVGEVIVTGSATEAKQDVQIAQGIVIEGKIDTVNSNLVTVQSKQDTTNTKLDTANSNLVIIQSKQDTSNTKLDTVNSNLVIVQGKQDTTNTKIDSTNTKIDSTNTKIDSTNTKLDTIDTDIKAEQPRIITQNVKPSTSNEKTTNLAANETWYGIGESTLGVAGIQVNFAASHDCQVEVQQSNDNINWDSRDMWEVPVTISTGLSLHGRTVQATGSYFRIRVTNLASTPTTYFRLSVALCPIVEALPRSLTSKGNLRVAIQENNVARVDYGGQQKLLIHDSILHELLRNLIAEIQMSNLHLSQVSGINFTELDKYQQRMVAQ